MKPIPNSPRSRRAFLAALAGAGAGAAIAPATAFASAAKPAAVSSSLAGAARATASASPAQLSRHICVFSKYLQFLEYEAMAETAAGVGFDGVDITVRPGGHVLPENVARDLPAAVAAVRAAGLDVPMITTAITAADDEYAQDIVTTAADLQIPYYRMGYLHYDAEKGVAASLEDLKPVLADLASLNEEAGIHGAYQNHDGTLVGSPVWDLAILLQDLDPSFIGVQYDIRHASVEGANSWRLGLDLLAPYVKTLITKDFRWAQHDEAQRVENVPLGKGSVDFDAFWSQIKTLEIRGPVSLHFEYPLPGEHESLSPEARRSQTAEIMQRDVSMLRKMLIRAGLE